MKGNERKPVVSEAAALKRIAIQLKRIADALERAHPPEHVGLVEDVMADIVGEPNGR